jgi:hypothetical protein
MLATVEDPHPREVDTPENMQTTAESCGTEESLGQGNGSNHDPEVRIGTDINSRSFDQSARQSDEASQPQFVLNAEPCLTAEAQPHSRNAIALPQDGNVVPGAAGLNSAVVGSRATGSENVCAALASSHNGTAGTVITYNVYNYHAPVHNSDCSTRIDNSRKVSANNLGEMGFDNTTNNNSYIKNGGSTRHSDRQVQDQGVCDQALHPREENP